MQEQPELNEDRAALRKPALTLPLTRVSDELVVGSDGTLLHHHKHPSLCACRRL